MHSTLFDRLRPIGFTPAIARAFDDAGIQPSWPARVTEVQRETVTLDDGTAPLPARLHPHLARRLDETRDTLAVGDWVAAARDAHQETWIHRLLPPASRIVRIDSDGRRHVLVSNIDIALLVMGLDGDFNPRRIERYLALVQGAGVWPVIVLTKLDRAAEPTPMIDALRQRIPNAVPIEAVDATSAASVSTLGHRLGSGQTAVLLGSSGAGKSTLTNTLMGSAVQSTGAVRADDSRGRHTTTTRTLHRLPGGACLIDTPGLRGLRVDLDEAQLAASFADIADLAQQCRFRDCRHVDEPGCVVRAGIDADRLKNFHKLSRESQREQMTYLERRRQVAEWKSRSRAAEQRMRMKRG
jgi:ribosome biogenesis GTPase / thiamine phosphate phosphatase